MAKENGYVVFENPYMLFGNITNAIGLWLNGVILLRRDSVKNRTAIYQKMKYVLTHGGSIIIYPEGYWNLDDNGEMDGNHWADGHNSENWLIQDFNIGAFRLAQELQCEIVPIILHYDEVEELRCYGVRGKGFQIPLGEDVFKAKHHIWEYMVEEYFYLMEKNSMYQREGKRRY